jgi:hypothetical protein
MYRDDVQGNVFYTELLLRKMVKPSQRVTQIIAYNMEHNSDSINVEKISESEIKISFAQYGNWWWQKSVGASSFSTDEYEVRIGEWNECFYKVSALLSRSNIHLPVRDSMARNKKS